MLQLKVVVEAVSDSPYPSRMTSPNRRSNSSSTSAGMAAPPEMAIRNDDTS